MKITTLILTLLLPLTAQAGDTETLTQLLETARDERNMPGLRAAVRFPDGRIVEAAVGVANKKSGEALTTTIGMPGGSTGKTFAAVLTLLLIEDGRLSLDDPISRWVGEEPWFNELPNASDIRVHHLLSHTSGIPDYPGTWAFNWNMLRRAIADGSAYFTPEELIGFSVGKKARHPAGEGYAYSDTGYLVLGRVIEAAAGRHYYELLTERVLEPLELADIRPQDVSALPDIAIGYSGGGSMVKKDGRMKFDPRSEWTGGGLVMTPADLARFHAALAEGQLLQASSFEAMLEAGWRDPKEPGWYYGYGLFVAEDRSSWGHSGLWSGYRSRVTHFADRGITVAVQANRNGRLHLVGLAREIADSLSVPET